MTKNELTLELKKASLQQFQVWVDLFKHALSIGCVLGVVWIIFSAVKDMTVGQDASSIAALAKIVEALNLGSILGYCWGLGATGLWLRERKGKKRAIRWKSQLQDKLEDGEPNRSSSQLTDTGDTPKTKREKK